MSPESPVYHESDYQQGKFKDGKWHCKHGDRAAERVAINSKNLAYVGMKFWTCVNRPSCRFYLWEDHVVEALKYHQVPEDVILKNTPRKRKRDGDITEYFPITPKTPRTRDVQEDGVESDEDIYEMSDREASPSGRHRDSSPTPFPRRSNAPSRSLGPPSPPPSWEEALEEAAVRVEVQLPPPPPPPARPSSRPYSAFNTLLSAPVITPSATVQASDQPVRPVTPPATVRARRRPLATFPVPPAQPRTPRRSPRRGTLAHNDMPPPPPANPPTPGSGGRRKLSVQELETYNVIVKALAGADVKLSVKGQNALRDIVWEEDFWIGS